MPYQLRALATLLEDQAFAVSTHMVVTTTVSPVSNDRSQYEGLGVRE